MIWNKARECMSRDELAVLQGKRLVELVRYVYDKVEYYRKKMWSIGLEPDDIRGIEDLEKLPFTTREDLIEAYPLGMDNALFLNKNGDMLTRSGVRTRLNAIVSQASMAAPSLSEKNITPHTFRHSVAMNLLASGVDISTIAIWLGHSSIETTHKYMVADMELKRKAMEKAGSAGNDSYHYKPSSDILNFLNSL